MKIETTAINEASAGGREKSISKASDFQGRRKPSQAPGGDRFRPSIMEWWVPSSHLRGFAVVSVGSWR
jgi:hypothetical protein